MIGATSGLTFNVIGHLKLIIVLAGGVAFFGDQMPPKKLAGVCVALAGIAWYSFQVRSLNARPSLVCWGFAEIALLHHCASWRLFASLI